ncbi:efflux RND transporter permease subunit [Bacillus licheniformis]|nr:efflux RND transporter permease subunit [Bacillus licheniformis]
MKANDANTVEVADNVKLNSNNSKRPQRLQIQLDIRSGRTDHRVGRDDAEQSDFGAIFAVVIILLFLRDIKSTLISVISIPLSLLIALLVLNQLDITLNIMTLGAMTVAIGRVVDDSIVVIETFTAA